MTVYGITYIDNGFSTVRLMREHFQSICGTASPDISPELWQVVCDHFVEYQTLEEAQQSLVNAFDLFADATVN